MVLINALTDSEIYGSVFTLPAWWHVLALRGKCFLSNDLFCGTCTFTKWEVLLHGLSGITQSLQVSKDPQLFDQLQMTVVQVRVFRDLKTSREQKGMGVVTVKLLTRQSDNFQKNHS